MTLKKLGVAMLAVFALCAFAASASQAAMWNSSGVGTWGAGETRPAEAKIGATTNTFVSKVLGSPFKITSSSISSKEGKLTQTGTTTAGLSGILVFGGLNVVEPAGCKSAATIETVPLTATAAMGNTGATAGAVYVKITPREGEVLATIKLTECAAAGSYRVKGSDYVEAVNSTSTAAIWQEALSSGVINESQGGQLRLEKEPATLAGSIQVALNSNESFSLEP